MVLLQCSIAMKYVVSVTHGNKRIAARVASALGYRDADSRPPKEWMCEALRRGARARA